MKLPAYEVLAQAFIAEGVDTVFTLMGDANMHWANAMAKRNGVRLIHIRHEHCAVAAAASYTWATGRPGVASITCGPGFTQIMTALATAVRGHVPLVIMLRNVVPAGRRVGSKNLSTVVVDSANAGSRPPEPLDG